jgi:hypothetical protein
MSMPSLSVTASSVPSGERYETPDEPSKPVFTRVSDGAGVAGVSRDDTGAAAAKV